MKALSRLQKLASFRLQMPEALKSEHLISVASPQARSVLGGALAGGVAGGYAGGEENRKKGILAGALAGGLGGGALADVMANRAARGFKAGDKANISSFTPNPEGAPNMPVYKEFARGHMAQDKINKTVDFSDSLGIRAEIDNVAIGDEHLGQLQELGDRYRNRAIVRGLGASGMGAVTAMYGNQRGARQEKQASILGVNLEKRASAYGYGGAAAGGLLGAAYGHFGTKKEDRNWKRTLGHAGVGALTGGAVGLAHKRGLDLDEIQEKKIDPLEEQLLTAQRHGRALEAALRTSQHEKELSDVRWTNAEKMYHQLLQQESERNKARRG